MQGSVRKWEQRELEQMTLHEWIAHDPISGNKLKDEVFEAAKDGDDYVFAITPNRKSRGYMDFSMAGHTYRYKFKSGKIETLK